MPQAEEAAGVAGRGAAGGEVAGDAVQTVLEVGLGQQGVRGRAGGLVDVDDAGGVVDGAQQHAAGFDARAADAGAAAGLGPHLGERGGGDADVVAGGVVGDDRVVGPCQPARPGGLRIGGAARGADGERGHGVLVGGSVQGVEDAGHELSGQGGDVGGRAGEGGVRAAGFGLEELGAGLGGEEVLDHVGQGTGGIRAGGQGGAAQHIGAAAGGPVR